MNGTTKKLKKLDKQFYKALNRAFGIKKYTFFGDMRGRYLTVVITAKERPEEAQDA